MITTYISKAGQLLGKGVRMIDTYISKMGEFLKRNEGMIIFTLTVMLGCYFATTYILLRYILENGIYVAN